MEMDHWKSALFNWVYFMFQFGKQHIENLFSDLQDGRRLLDLLEGLTGQKLVCDLFIRKFTLTLGEFTKTPETNSVYLF